MKNNMNKKALKILAVTLVALIACGGVTGVVYAANSAPHAAAASAAPSATAAPAGGSNSNTAGKEETVYAIADPNGTVQKVIVSEWLKNADRKDTIQDFTELGDIENTNGDETFTSTGSNAYVWNAAGNDIHYRGTTQKDLPVKVAVRYYLDGSEIQPKDLAGKSGHVKICFDYTNTAKVSADIGGAKKDVYVPFLMVSGLMLDNDKFNNVTVSSGQVLNDGSRDIVLGYALPGVADSLGLKSDKQSVAGVDIPSSVVIEADTTGFQLPATLTVAMTGLFDKLNLNSNSSPDDLKNSAKDLTDAVQQLIDGSVKLFDGTSELYDKSQDLKDGVATLLGGAKDLNAGASKANSGAAQLRDGLGTLSKNSASLKSGAKEIVNAVFVSTTTQLREKLVASGMMTQSQADAITLTSANYASVFKQLSGAVTVTPAQVEAQLRAKLSAMTADQQNMALSIAYDLLAANPKMDYTDAVTSAAKMMTDAATAKAACSVINASWLADPAHQALIGKIMAATGAPQETAAKIAAVALALDAGNPAAQISNASTILTHAGAVAATTVSVQKVTALCTVIANAATSTGNASLDAVKGKLDDVMKFYNGLAIYTGGVDSAYAGAKKLAGGTGELLDGTSDLLKGVNTLNDGTKKLVSGVGDLNDGAKQLKEGLQKFNDEGIKKLTDAFGGDLSGLVDRLKAIADAGRNYRSFAGIPDGMNGSVKFIFRTDTIE